MKRFDLEQSIMQCWNIIDDLEMLIEQEQVTELNIEAVITLYKCRFNKCWEDFEDSIKDRSI
jgi:hypothetical protein